MAGRTDQPQITNARASQALDGDVPVNVGVADPLHGIVSDDGRSTEKSETALPGKLTALGFPDLKVESTASEPIREPIPDPIKSVELPADKPAGLPEVVPGAQKVAESVSEISYRTLNGALVVAGSKIPVEITPSNFAARGGESLKDIAKGKMPADSPAHLIDAYVKEIAKINDLTLTAQSEYVTKSGDNLILPGHDQSGNLVFKDSRGTQYVYDGNGALNLTYSDGTGYRGKGVGVGAEYRYTAEHFGPRAQDNYKVVSNADGAILENTKVEPLAGGVAQEKENLIRFADKNILLAKERAEFTTYMSHFEARAKRDGLPTQEVARTYRDLASILSARGREPLTERERVRLVNGAIRAISDPKSNDQGAYGTCQTAVMENRMYAQEPSKVTAILSQIAREGKFVTVTGTRVEMDAINLRAHGQAALNDAKGSNSRTYTSQVFEMAARNVFIAGWNERSIPPGDRRLLQEEDNRKFVVGKPPDSAEDSLREYDFRFTPPKNVSASSDTSVSMMVTVDRQLTGRFRPEHLISFTTKEDLGTTKLYGRQIATEENLRSHLTRLKHESKGEIYAVLRMQGNSDLLTLKPGFRRLNNAADLDMVSGHVVNLIDYNVKNDRVALDNQWGNTRDHLNKPVTVKEVFSAMRPIQGAVLIKRLDGEFAKLSGDEYSRQMNLLMGGLELRWTRLKDSGAAMPVTDITETLAAYTKIKTNRPQAQYKDSDIIVQKITALRGQ